MYTIIIKKCIIIFIGFFILPFRCYCNDDDSAKRNEIKGKILSAYEKKMKKKYGLHPCCSGGGEKNGIWLVKIGFNIYHPLAQVEARKIAVDCAEELLQAINSSEELRPFLRDYPFSTYNIELVIFSFNKDKSPIFDPFFEVTSVQNGKIFYLSVDPLNDKNYKTTLEESYGEALAIVQKESSVSK